MVNEYKAGALILSQIEMLSEAYKLLEDVVEPAILGGISACVRDAAEQNDWQGEFNLEGEYNNCWVAPRKWKVAAVENEPKAWFEFGFIKDNDDFWTSLLCGQGTIGGESGFILAVDEATYGRKRAWRAFFQCIDPILVEKLKAHGFRTVEDDNGKLTFFLPVLLDSAQLANTWEKHGEFFATAECFDPLKVALQAIQNSWTIFDAILSRQSRNQSSNTRISEATGS
jgi:hypothetical protein